MRTIGGGPPPWFPNRPPTPTDTAPTPPSPGTTNLLWAQACASYEAEFTKDAWRHSDPARVAYLTHLVNLGYAEQLMITNADTISGATHLDVGTIEDGDGD